LAVAAQALQRGDRRHRDGGRLLERQAGGLRRQGGRWHQGVFGEAAVPVVQEVGIDLIAGLEPGDQIVECFRRGGGIPYSAFPRFQEVMAEDSGAVHDATLIDVTLPLVPGLIDRLRRAST
jgi:hypothetical protein